MVPAPPAQVRPPPYIIIIIIIIVVVGGNGLTPSIDRSINRSIAFAFGDPQGGGVDAFVRLPSRRSAAFLAQWHARVAEALRA